MARVRVHSETHTVTRDEYFDGTFQLAPSNTVKYKKHPSKTDEKLNEKTMAGFSFQDLASQVC